MKPILPEHNRVPWSGVSAAVRDLNPGVFSDGIQSCTLPPQYPTKGDVKQERTLQADAERWLTLHGFRLRTPDEILRPGDCAGWFIHLHEAKRNPILLDLLILYADGTWREVELKSETGKPNPHQAALIARGGKLARNMTEFVAAVKNS